MKNEKIKVLLYLRWSGLRKQKRMRHRLMAHPLLLYFILSCILYLTIQQLLHDFERQFIALDYVYARRKFAPNLTGSFATTNFLEYLTSHIVNLSLIHI